MTGFTVDTSSESRHFTLTFTEISGVLSLGQVAEPAPLRRGGVGGGGGGCR